VALGISKKSCKMLSLWLQEYLNVKWRVKRIWNLQRENQLLVSHLPICYSYSSWENLFTEVSATEIQRWYYTLNLILGVQFITAGISPQLTNSNIWNRLEGSTTHCIQGLPITEHNYNHTVELLEERFDNLQFIVVAHVDKWIKIPLEEWIKIPVAIDKQRFMFDKVNAHIRDWSLQYLWPVR